MSDYCPNCETNLGRISLNGLCAECARAETREIAEEIAEAHVARMEANERIVRLRDRRERLQAALAEQD